MVAPRARHFLLLLACTGIFDVSATAARSRGISFQVDRQAGISVSVSINGSGPFRLLLDTGSTRSAISARLATSLHLKAIATTDLVTGAGNATRQVVRLDVLALGPVAREALPVVVFEDAMMARLGAGLDGILGQDFLLDQSYTLDYSRHELTWESQPVAPARGDARLALVNDEGRWLAVAAQGPRTPPLRLVPDSGASTIVIFDRGSSLPLRMTALPLPAALVTIAGAAPTRAVILNTLAIDRILLRDQPALVVDRRQPDAPAGDGLLPLSLFARVTFDATGKAMILRAR